MTPHMSLDSLLEEYLIRDLAKITKEYLSRKSSKCLEVETTAIIEFKTLIEILKDCLDDVVLEFKQNDEFDYFKSESVEYDIIMPKDLNNERNHDVKGGNKGIKITEVNGPKTTLIHVNLDSKQFAKFIVSKPVYDVAFNLNELHRLLKPLGKNDILNISIDENDTQMIVLNIDNKAKNHKIIQKLRIKDKAKASYLIPKTGFDVAITMDATEFHKICDEAIKIADFIEITSDGNSIMFYSKGDESEFRSILYNKHNEHNEPNEFVIKSPDTKNDTIVRAVFEIRYLIPFSKCSKFCNKIQIYMKNNYPIIIKYPISALGEMFFGLVPITEPEPANNHVNDDNDVDDNLDDND